MKKSFTKVLMLALAVISVGVLGSCKDYEEDKYNDLQHQIADQNKTLSEVLADQKAYLDALKTQLQDLEAQVAAIKSCDCDPQDIQDIVADIETLQNQLNGDGGVKDDVNQNTQDIADILNKINDINNMLVSINARLDAINLDPIYDQLDAQGVKITTIETTINEILDNIALWNDRLTAVETQAANALAQAQANAAAIGIITENIDIINGNINDINIEIADINNELSDKATKEEMLQVLNTAIALYADAVNYADMLAEGLAEDIANNKAAIEENQLAIFNLQFATDRLSTLVDIHGEQLIALEERLEALENDVYNKMVTGVVLQGSKNPVFGSINLPAGVTSNVLVAYYGSAVQGGVFPYAGTPGDGRFAKRSDELTAGDIAIMGESFMIPQGTIINSAADNAGKLYVTVNPNTVNFAGQKIELVNSKDEASAIVLSPLAPNTDELTLGYSRAGNGLYMAQAQVTEDAIESLKFPVERWKDAIKDAYNNAKKNNVKVAASELVLTLYNQMDGMLPALAAKATWTDKDGNDHSVYSNYNVAATAIKPLSYSFAEDLDIEEIPGYKKALDLINTLSDNITKNLNNALSGLNNIKNVDPVTIGSISMPTMDLIEVELNIPVEYSAMVGDNGHLLIRFTDPRGEDVFDTGWIEQEIGTVIVKDGKYYLQLARTDIDINPQVAAIFDAINNALAATNDDLARVVNNVNSIIAEIHALQGKIDESVADIKSQLVNMLDKVNGKLVNWINSANKALMPAIVVNQESGASVASRAWSIPTMASKNVTLMPTSYTGELLAPAYKKIVACTKAWNANGTENSTARDAFNAQENLNVILDGGNMVKVPATLESGIKYEITYAAVDYSGMIAVRKCYIQCK